MNHNGNPLTKGKYERVYVLKTASWNEKKNHLQILLLYIYHYFLGNTKKNDKTFKMKLVRKYGKTY